ncbi:MAG: glycoside hydrolase family 3 N-terminal domain-containing protein [Bacteroidales bacterium]
MKKVIFICFFLSLYAFANKDYEVHTQLSFEKNPFSEIEHNSWVDSVYTSMSLDERIGQLFMVAAYTNPSQSNTQEVVQLIQDYHIGGVIFMKGTPIRQAKTTNILQSHSSIPLMTAIDGEWGLAMRLDSTISFPKQIMLGAIQDNALLYEMGFEIGRQCKRLGVHINFAPVIDINNNAQNPVINFRSFGEIKENVATKGLYYMTGMQDRKVITTAKHFPGHGDTDSDSHHTLPTIPHSKERLDTLELYPFKHLINNNLTGMMIAHLHIPALDDTRNRASTLSPHIVTDILQKDLGFSGLIFTDALNMKGVANHFSPGELEITALQAGNDVLLFPENVPVAIKQIKKAIKKGDISEEIINNRCKKILRAKKWLGLDSYTEIDTTNLYQDLNTPKAQALNQKLIRSSITVLKDDNSLLPFRNLDTTSIAYVTYTADSSDTFYETAQNYTRISHFYIPTYANQTYIDSITDTLSHYSAVIVNIRGKSMYPSRKFGIHNAWIETTKHISQHPNTILVFHTNPYALDYFTNITKSVSTVVAAYDFTNKVMRETPQVMFGAYHSTGTLPISAGSFKAGTGKFIPSINRLSYTPPHEAGLNADTLHNIDSIVHEGIVEKAFPGCQVLVARRGKVVYQKSFGHFTYDTIRPVQNTDIYDIASMTKSLGTTLSLMKLYEKNLFNLNQTLGDYFNFEGIDTTGKDTIQMKNILTHQAQLHSWIPFYQYLIKDFFVKNNNLYSRHQSSIFPYKLTNYMFLRHNFRFVDSSISDTPDSIFSIKVAENVYINNTYRDTIFNMIFQSPLNEKQEVVYSDLGFYLLPEIIKKQSNQRIDTFLYSNYFNTMGADRICYKPLHRYSRENIVPTEHDYVFRKQTIQGYVHDPGAAMLGGISGHAGLFSNTNDIAKICQMLINEGTYGNIRYLKPETISLFTSCPFCEEGNRKGYGFDKEDPDPNKLDPTCKCTSEESFGHSGFTGTIFWVDPKYDIIYVFLSNRVYPEANNLKLGRMNIRPRIQQVIYDAIIN